MAETARRVEPYRAFNYIVTIVGLKETVSFTECTGLGSTTEVIDGPRAVGGSGGGKTHHSLAMQVAVGVDVALGKLEVEFGRKHIHTFVVVNEVSPSCASTSVAIAISPFWFNAGPSHFEGQALTRFQRATSV